MSTKTTILQLLPSQIIIHAGVRTLTGLDLEQAIAENTKRRLEFTTKVAVIKTCTNSNERNILDS